MIFTLLLALLSLPAHASGGATAQVLVTRGDVRLDGKVVQTGESLAAEGKLETAPDASAKLELLPSHTILELSPSSEAELGSMSPDGAEQVVLDAGTLRAHVKKSPSAKKPTFYIKTPTATLGVRGTDFLGISNPILGESEIVVFEGLVAFSSAADPSDRKMVSAGHWGGIGGRFGAKTHVLIKLPENALRYFDQATAVK